ncbi:MAG: phosphoribosylformylglycinamidine synthase subunit PurQ [Methanobrevibacter wolinii]|uniref:phosphoribosylformylglycinamidine synthase subunit PurQ n=1 Tax=Methanobrevibacter wolinii TaxID=190977 RepID=UPI0005B2B7A4|nr:phosphoribosylformylglycinamidine synthase subunit PurQ [Methanobrevibacter wolinii]MDD5960600.1 phosphoribosylformylglycinamidine synthase subunit PurQ [Methanobrevibacter wolinii]
MKIGVIRFPGSNCDRDVYHALKLAGAEPSYIWWKDEDLTDYDGVVIPGGFSYGDYLRAGAIASITPVIDGVKDLVKEEKPVLGICNGAQILGEIGLVPGIFITNEYPKFNCETTNLKVTTNRSPFTSYYKKGEIIEIPIAHAEGRFYTEDIDLLHDQDQILFQFADENPNGSIEKITGICDESGLVCAMMPHPERACEEILGSTDGLKVFKGMIDKS